jgi:hypothetical protein
MDRSAIVAALEAAGLPVFEPIIAFQQEFGGITYRVRGNSGGMSWGLFQPKISGFTSDGQHYYFECGQHRVAQLGFYLDRHGTLYVNERFAAPVAIASSVEKYMESDAIVNQLIDLAFTCWLPLGTRAQGELAVQNRLERLELPIIKEASDQYTTWWGHNRLRVVQHVFWSDGPALNRFVAYARTPAEARPLITALRDLFPALRSANHLLPWPGRY